MNKLEAIRAAISSLRRSRLLECAAVGSAILATALTSGSVYGQGTYYPVNPAGSTNYSGIEVSADADLLFLQQTLQSLYPSSNLTLQSPQPAGQSLPTQAQYTAAVAQAFKSILTSPAPAGVSVQSLANESIAYNTSIRAATATSIAQSILANSSSVASDLNNVVGALAASQPTNIDTILPSILQQAGTSATLVNNQTLPQLVNTAISAIPSDLTRVLSIVTSGVQSLAQSNVPAAQRSLLFTQSGGFISTVVNAQAGNPAVLAEVAQGLTNSNFASATGLASLQTVVTTAANAVPSQSNASVAAIADGALFSQGSQSATIQAGLDGALSGGFKSYGDSVIAGYGLTSANFASTVAGNNGFADAYANGAAVKGAIPIGTIAQLALVNGNGTSAQNQSIVAEMTLASPNNWNNIIQGSVNQTTHTPYGAASFGDIAYGASYAAPYVNVENVEQALILNSRNASGVLNQTNVNSIVDQSIRGAFAAGNSDSFTDIVAAAQNNSKATAGLSAGLVKQAIDSINAVGGQSFLAVVGALAGDTGGANRTAIETASYGTGGPSGGGELQLTGGDYVAAQNGANTVVALQSTNAAKFSAFVSNLSTSAASSSANNSVIASLAGALVVDPTDYAWELASAIKQSAVPHTTLVTITKKGLVNASLNSTVDIVDQIAEQLKLQAISAAGITDIEGVVAHSILLNPAATTSIVVASTVIDPDHVHFIAHAAAYEAPGSVAGAVPSLFSVAQITSASPVAAPTISNQNGVQLAAKSQPGTIAGAIVDQPAAAAAITAGLTTGLIEANPTNLQADLVATVTAAVTASVQQQGVALQAPLHPFYNSTIPGDSTAVFAQSDGTATGTVSGYRAVGAAGAITGFVAEETKSSYTTIDAITKAVLTSAGNAAKPYDLAIAQAAAQALAWVGNVNLMTAPAITIGTTNSAYVGNPIYDIAQAILAGGSTFSLTQLEYAAQFGITQAQSGVIGAGALGLGATGINSGTLVVKSTGNANSDFYQHRSATGTPVTDIFNL